ncbi:MAG: hypothetical protein ACE5KT_07270 [Methanosarcinales archaeon]
MTTWEEEFKSEIEQRKYLAKRFADWDVILFIIINLTKHYTAKSDFWFKKEDLQTIGIDQNEYIEKVYKIKEVI